MRKKPFTLDERERNVYHNLITVLYFITIAALTGMQLYRQFVLGQPTEQWNDIAIFRCRDNTISFNSNSNGTVYDPSTSETC